MSEDKKLNLLGKIVTIRKTDGTGVRGLCVNQFEDSIIVAPDKDETKRVAVLNVNISEIIFDDFEKLTFREAYKHG